MHKKSLLRFSDFINESNEETIEGFQLDKRFPWTEEIANLIDNVVEQSDNLKNEYNYDRHRNSKGFEFDIKMRVYPDSSGLAKKYNTTEESIDYDWNLFLEDNNFIVIQRNTCPAI